ncbi:type I glyceraldehyde-3-phosphate dehydrogenase [Candidatus Parcubacteria bacterium]|nr:type I glyceraldehyde-3-phosphate dehydrogenase [Patescibacteria group bacterium]MBU4381238.1 type I glyceraldehyde-3-phosphate dehydrogenase [Patescibacteria group bacterium]MCG2689270.1 type I glyceraldehyde-3-phosphate dehydrogenase [Candidatus Parcubacteria bacterium]
MEKSNHQTTTLLETAVQLEPKKLVTDSKRVRIAINGFGRIGRAVLKIAQEREDVEVVAINDLSDIATLAHLLKYDSVYGIYSKTINIQDNLLFVDGKKIQVLSIPDPANLPWKSLEIDVVVECTGRLTKDGASSAHVTAGAKKVIISAPAKGGNVKTIILGVNDGEYKGEPLVSNGSCTTNCIAPVVKVVENSFGVEQVSCTTVHAMTSEQNIVDSAPPALHKDLRRARAAGSNIIPTTSGAATALVEAFPNLVGKVEVVSLRVPIICGSITDFTFVTKKETTVEEVNKILTSASLSGEYKNVLATTSDPIVSSDIIGNPASSLVDLSLTKVISKNLVKIFSWYDNEWGYSNRLIDLCQHISS